MMLLKISMIMSGVLMEVVVLNRVNLLMKLENGGSLLRLIVGMKQRIVISGVIFSSFFICRIEVLFV